MIYLVTFISVIFLTCSSEHIVVLNIYKNLNFEFRTDIKYKIQNYNQFESIGKKLIFKNGFELIISYDFGQVYNKELIKTSKEYKNHYYEKRYKNLKLLKDTSYIEEKIMIFERELIGFDELHGKELYIKEIENISKENNINLLFQKETKEFNILDSLFVKDFLNSYKVYGM